MTTSLPGLDVTVERGVATVRATPGAAKANLARLGEQALAQLKSIGTKGVRGLVVDLSVAGASDGPGHTAVADAFAPLVAAWEARGLAVAIVVPRGRGQLEAARVIAQSAPRWGRAVANLEDAALWVGAR